MFKCPNCEFEKDSLRSIALHAKKIHNESSESIHIKMFCSGEKPTCACGCGGSVRFRNIVQGYSKYSPGHQARVNNNWGHNEKVQQKSQQTRREMHEKGEIKIWNKGKKMEDDPRIQAQAEKCRQAILSNPDKRKERSERMKKQWETGNLVPLTGPDHSRWKGGTSAIGALCHGNRRLYQEWKFPALQASGFKCNRCPETQNLHVHHSGERMSEIIQRFSEELNPEGLDDFDVKLQICEAVVDHHLENQVDHEVLCERCHAEEHPSLNF